MRVHPHLPSRPFTATVIDACGAALCACRAAKRPAPPEPRMRMSVEASRIRPSAAHPCVSALGHAEGSEGGLAPRARRGAHCGVEAPAMAVHGDEQRAESPDAKLPQRLRIEVVEVDVFDR